LQLTVPACSWYTAGARKREDANGTRESRCFAANQKAENKIDALAGAQAGNRDEVEGVMAIN